MELLDPKKHQHVEPVAAQLKGQPHDTFDIDKFYHVHQDRQRDNMMANNNFDNGATSRLQD